MPVMIDNQFTGVAIFRPLNIHRATVVFLNLYGLFCQFLHFFVGQREDVTLFLRYVFDFNLLAVKKQGKYVGICGQGPSDHEDFAAWLMEEGIDSLSLNPDTVVQTWLSLAELKK